MRWPAEVIKKLEREFIMKRRLDESQLASVKKLLAVCILPFFDAVALESFLFFKAGWI